MSDEDHYEIPLQDQRVFGAGIKRRRVRFVPSSSDQSTPPVTGGRSAESISNLYLSLVLPKETSAAVDAAASTTELSEAPAYSTARSRAVPEQPVCEICNLPLTTVDLATTASQFEVSSNPPETVARASTSRPHEASIAHQVCLEHSYPPSHLDRSRKGLTYLSSYGWDPDSRLGLGASGQGIQFPIKAKAKDDKMGIGVVLPKAGERRKKEKVEKLDAGKVRKLQEKDKKRAERLRDIFYRNDDVERYLGNS